MDAANQSQRAFPFSRHRKLTLRFRLPYYTVWGQKLVVVGSAASLGCWDPLHGLSMSPHHLGDQLIWQGFLVVDENFNVHYHYCVVDEQSKIVRREYGQPRSFTAPSDLPDGSFLHLFDLWQDGSSPENLLSKSAFREAIFRSDEAAGTINMETLGNILSDEFPSSNLYVQDSVLVRFKIFCPQLKSGHTVHLIGGASALGDWQPNQKTQLLASSRSYWQADYIIKRNEFPLRYRYIFMDKTGNVISEINPERELCFDSFAGKVPMIIIHTDGHFKESLWRGAGLAIPVFSLRSKESIGVGEFLDLKMLVDFAVRSGLHLIQLLPINDTSVHGTWWDSYPYSSLSVFALHPLYLRLQELSSDMPQYVIEEIEMAKKQLDLKDVDYEATMATKLAIAKKLFHLEKDKVLSSNVFEKFYNNNQEWLKPYAAFCFLRDFFGTSDHTQWGLFSKFSKEKLERLVSPCSDHYNVIAFNYYLQYHLHLQLLDAAEYARRNRVVLKGDLPIGVDRHSVDTWVFPTLFRMNTSTGAPPDYFDKNGQNWGFPTYNWEEMSKDNYSWWRARLSQMAKYFTAYRIDHVLGFFRIWELPDHAVTGLMGKFRPSIPLSQEELECNGIWDFDRLSRPYIRAHILQEKFGDGWADIASAYFNEYQHLCYEFKDEYDTEKKVLIGTVEKSNTCHSIEKIEGLRSKLFELIQDIVLIRDQEDLKMFYPRFGLEQTFNFKELDNSSKSTIQRLYYDYYFQRQEGLWRENALKTLPVLLMSSNMLACGEDLGLIPQCVQPVMHELGLIGLRIQRMPNTPGQEFGFPYTYEYTTVCAPSCHDCSTLRAWWEQDENRRIRYFRDVLGFSEMPPSKCDPHVSYAIIQQHMDATSMWAIFPLQDLLALKEEYIKRPAKEETINDPTNPKHYWRFRLHVSLESLLHDNEFTSMVRELVQESGRSVPSITEVAAIIVEP